MLDEISTVRRLRGRLLQAEQEIERLRGSFRGVIYKLTKDCIMTALSIAEEALKNAVRIYPHKIDGAPKDPTEVKR